ncbi:PREDICTED: uncharacterized protein LOC104783757 [Camelina sativa]|uniref:Uncharacterized protein LOC104783757 n=1 Tax=Camelina sativa TaxID=90675 RepID=A0ABM0YX16_CAMSA|nr:PREDICTED: uncharacterized protein LOC104783757 [Camelina sativa]
MREYPPESLTGEQIYSERLSGVNPPKTKDVGGNGHEKKMPGYGKQHNWHKESILWQLPYWRDLNLRHNIDVMHTEKNFLDNIMYTLMRVKGKSKDTIMSRLDLVKFCSRPHLHLDSRGKAPFPAYALTDEARTSLLECVKHSIKFPDGYSSDLASCVDMENGKTASQECPPCFISMFEDFLSAKYPGLPEKELSAKRADEYHLWVKEYVTYWNATNPFPTWVQEIVHGPLNKVKTWPMYFTRGYLFHTENHGAGRNTCNYGVCAKGENYTDESDAADFYGTITDIIELQYEGMVNLRITLFKCKWYDPVIGRGTRISNGGVVDVLSTRKYNKYEPFILASQAEQVCYIPYPYVKKPKQIWFNVLKVNPRGNISGEYVNSSETTLLQTENDDAVLMTTIEDIVLDNLEEEVNPINLDYGVEDVEPEDEFLCNLSSSDDEEPDDEESS